MRPARLLRASLATGSPQALRNHLLRGCPPHPRALGQTDRATSRRPLRQKPSAALASRAAARKGRKNICRRPGGGRSGKRQRTEPPPALGGGPKSLLWRLARRTLSRRIKLKPHRRCVSASPVMKPTMAMRGISAARAQWRISADGQLQRLVAADDWTRVLADQPTTSMLCPWLEVMSGPGAAAARYFTPPTEGSTGSGSRSAPVPAPKPAPSSPWNSATPSMGPSSPQRLALEHLRRRSHMDPAVGRPDANLAGRNQQNSLYYSLLAGIFGGEEFARVTAFSAIHAALRHCAEA